MGIFGKIFDFGGRRKAKKAANEALRERLTLASAQRAGLAAKLQAVKEGIGQLPAAARAPGRTATQPLPPRARIQEQQDESKQRQLENNPAYRFLYKGDVVTGFSSSNVKAFWYDIEKHLLYIQFKDQSTYEYGARLRGVTTEFALSLFYAKSKGTWVWDNLRIRGTKLGHKVDYALVIGPQGPKRWNPVGGRLWEQTPERALEHAKEVTKQSGHEDIYEGIFRFWSGRHDLVAKTNQGRLTKPQAKLAAKRDKAKLARLVREQTDMPAP
jgi:hypothetical protein